MIYLLEVVGVFGVVSLIFEIGRNYGRVEASGRKDVWRGVLEALKKN